MKTRESFIPLDHNPADEESYGIYCQCCPRCRGDKTLFGSLCFTCKYNDCHYTDYTREELVDFFMEMDEGADYEVIDGRWRKVPANF